MLRKQNINITYTSQVQRLIIPSKLWYLLKSRSHFSDVLTEDSVGIEILALKLKRVDKKNNDNLFCVRLRGTYYHSSLKYFLFIY